MIDNQDNPNLTNPIDNIQQPAVYHKTNEEYKNIKNKFKNYKKQKDK